MARADFYLLNQTEPEARYTTVCRLTEKAYQRGHKVFIYATDQNEAHLIDEMLWQFKAESFVPHHLLGEGPGTAPAVQVGYADQRPRHRDIVVNLTKTKLAFGQEFQRVLEIVSGNDTDREQGRENYKSYRAQGYSLKHHEITE